MEIRHLCDDGQEVCADQTQHVGAKLHRWR